ncbi:UDP-N-acetylmuramoyl-tripeptide--D-alanyl-D-alanine ligase [Marivita hallyeonensis]|uniref:UDP-N-acetylmuramoyl-tripeptide--D-alanyl-D-alanine ligase n=1 Tax=Marivita hallyeonensis TaxID=996342 RepID=A0A1M5PCB3_9RHOB|nr:UDP-N-acetylmuramoyl-tripeptide--D-alanyl-D-alanine ligase [Marivita hallyeonensis]SHG98873.1 UDP-N-acetylmuramoyl-tripeptide--D-alanyl-D-alanine ligase [Marivita hallyeonensis]
MTLWTSAEAAEATGGQVTTDWTATGVSIDTRTLQPGDLFIALKAARDGHDFVAQALDKGAAAALVSRVPEGVADDAPLLIVDDVQTGLEALGRAGRARTEARVVGVTGSVGKTSTKEMLRTVLGAHGRVHAAEASYNNHWGVPLTLARMPKDTEFAVIEIGMNHPGEIAPLSRLARPHVAMVTIVAPAHLEAFESIDGIAHEKASIYEGLEPGGVAIWNGDLPTSGILSEWAKRCGGVSVSFGESQGCDMQVTDLRVSDTGSVVQARTNGAELLYKIDAPGRHFAVNGAAVLAVCEALGLDRALSLAAIGRWQPGAGRGQTVTVALDPADRNTTLSLIDDAYNANPASVGASLAVLASAPVQHDIGRVSRGRRIAVLGDMKELGPTGPDLHAGLAQLPATQDLDRVHCVGPLMRHLYDALPDRQRGLWRETSAEMAADLPRLLDAGDVILVKGSLSMALARVVDAIRDMGESEPRSEGRG